MIYPVKLLQHLLALAASVLVLEAPLPLAIVVEQVSLLGVGIPLVSVRLLLLAIHTVAALAVLTQQLLDITAFDLKIRAQALHTMDGLMLF